MFRWVPYAMVRVCLFLMGGILLGVYQPNLFSENALFTFIISLLILYVALHVRKVGNLKVLSGVVGLAVVFTVGYLNVLLNTDSRKEDHILHVHRPIEFYKVTISRYAEEKERTWKIESEIGSVKSGAQWYDRSGKVLLYFAKEDFPEPPQYGDVYLIKGNPRDLSDPGNPGEFDYKRFLSFRKIYHQHFLREDDAHKIDFRPSSRVVSWAFTTRQWADRKLKSVVKGEREGAVASALVLGVTDGLDNELLQAYSATGAMHVLAVSGLHVGIIYAILLLLLKPLNKTPRGKWMVAIIGLVVLWAYAFVTGLSPSVLRAVTMFSFVALARPAKQRTNIYNTLAASAFCLLLYEPYLIMSVGFQLSYIAVLGIVALQPLIYPWWEPRSRFWDEVWKITCVSIVAQVATFALGLLYFHQFPNYFLFSNLLVIPISFVVLVAGLAVLAFNFIAPVFSLMGFILEWSIKIMNYIVFVVETLPYSIVENIYITTFQCWLLMAAVLALIFTFANKKFSYLPPSVSCFLVFVGLQWWHAAEDVDVQKFTVYKVNGHSAIDLISHGQSIFLTDSILRSDAERTRFHIQPNRLKHGVETVTAEFEAIKFFFGYTLFSWNGQTFVQVTERKAILPKNLKVDWLIISNNALSSLTKINHVKFNYLILDSSNSLYFADRIIAEAADRKIAAHSVLHQGAFSYSR